LFDAGSCQCSDYLQRKRKVPDCVKLTPKKVREIAWLPRTCGYRLAAEGKDLFDWHHLISGSRETVHTSGASMLGRVTALESDMSHDEDYFDHVLDDQP
jgi:uncharacterized cysteine cluster protein YcgN (CxxCxxCC family)